MQIAAIGGNQDSTTGSTATVCRRRNSLWTSDFGRFLPPPPEPKVPRSNRGGDTSDQIDATRYAASCNRLRRLAFCALSLARVATSVGHGSRSSWRFCGRLQCKSRQFAANPGEQNDTRALTTAGGESTTGSTGRCAGAGHRCKALGPLRPEPLAPSLANGQAAQRLPEYPRWRQVDQSTATLPSQVPLGIHCAWLLPLESTSRSRPVCHALRPSRSPLLRPPC
jgi:hypothetical protein